MTSRAPSSEAAAAGPRGLQFKLLGPLEASRDGVRIDLGPRKQRAVLALLLLNANRVLPTERLIDDLWGDSPPETARSALQVYVAGLRKALGSDGAALRTHPPGYVLDLEAGVLDLDRFVELRAEARSCDDNERRAALLHEALALWRDTPLAELRTEPFSTAAAAQLEELRLSALEERIDADLAIGHRDALVPELEALVAQHPYRERLRGQLMLALYRSGRQAEALEAYQAGRRVLNEDLGLKPGKDLRELETAILRQDDELAANSRVSMHQPAVDEHEPRPVTVLFPREAATDVATPAVSRRRFSRGRSRRALLLVAVAVAAVVAATAVWTLGIRSEPAPITALPNQVAVIDATTGSVVDAVDVGIRPGPVTVGAGSVWIGNLDDKTLTRIDPATRRLVETVPLGATPTAIAFGEGAVWAAHGLTGRVSRVDPRFGSVTSAAVTGRSLYYPSAGIAAGAGSVWAVFGDSTLARLAPSSGRRLGSALVGAGPAGVIVHDGAIWVSNTGDATVQRFDPDTFEQGPVQIPVSVGRGSAGIAASKGAVWIASTGDDTVTRIDTDSRSVVTIPVGDEPNAVAVGADSVWVANAAAGAVSKIDPAKKEVVGTIEVGGAPSGIAVADGFVWVTVQAP